MLDHGNSRFWRLSKHVRPGIKQRTRKGHWGCNVPNHTVCWSYLDHGVHLLQLCRPTFPHIVALFLEQARIVLPSRDNDREDTVKQSDSDEWTRPVQGQPRRINSYDFRWASCTRWTDWIYSSSMAYISNLTTRA